MAVVLNKKSSTVKWGLKPRPSKLTELSERFVSDFRQTTNIDLTAMDHGNTVFAGAKNGQITALISKSSGCQKLSGLSQRFLGNAQQFYHLFGGNQVFKRVLFKFVHKGFHSIA